MTTKEQAFAILTAVWCDPCADIAPDEVEFLNSHSRRDEATLLEVALRLAGMTVPARLLLRENKEELQRKIRWAMARYFDEREPN